MDAYNRAMSDWQQYGQGKVIKGAKDIPAQLRPQMNDFTRWSQQTILSPQQQAILDQQQGIQSGFMNQAQSMLGRVQDAYADPFDTSGMAAWAQGPQAGNLQAGNLDPNQFFTQGAGQGIMGQLDTSSLGDMPQADAQERQRIENALFERMRPEHQQAQAGLESQLANMGLTRGSEAWNREMQRIGDQQSRERFNAMEIGGQEMQRLFGMGMQGRQQGWNELMGAGQFQNAAQQQAFNQQMGANAQNYGMAQSAGAQNFAQQAAAGQQNFNQEAQAAQFQNQMRAQQMQEAQALRNMPLNELNALRSGSQVVAPNFEQFNQSRSAGGVDYSGAANNQYNAAMDAFNAKQQGISGAMGGLFSLGSAALGNPMGLSGLFSLSDGRVKKDVRVLFTLPNGIEVCSYRMIGKEHHELGVIAQQVKEIMPDAVQEGKDGLLRVNYDLVLC
jgi:hypothetical protein